MQNRATAKAIIVLAAVVIVLGITLRFAGPGRPESRASSADRGGGVSSTPDSTPSHFRRPAGRAQEGQEEVALGEAGLAIVSREEVEVYLQRHGRSAASLLAAFHAMGEGTDPDANRDLLNHPVGNLDYLNEAATNFPEDPRVQFAILSRDLSPNDRRQWLDRFKDSAPGNALPNYLSAADHFRNGQPEAALAELQAAAAKPQFENYGMESLPEAEDLCRASGRSPRESLIVAMSGVVADFLPELAALKQVANGTADLQKQQWAAGDVESAGSLAQLGLALADRLRGGDSGKFLIRHLVGNALEAIVLANLEPNTACDFLQGKTPAQRLEELRQQKAEIKQLSAEALAAFPALSEAEQSSYSQRVKLNGELETMRWWRQQRGGVTPNSGN
jgi:hypothetical protein